MNCENCRGTLRHQFYRSHTVWDALKVSLSDCCGRFSDTRGSPQRKRPGSTKTMASLDQAGQKQKHRNINQQRWQRRWWLKHFVVRLREKTCSPNSSAGRTSFCVFLSHMAYVINDSTINMIFCVIIITTICSILSQICDEATKHNSLENIHVLGLQFLHFFMHDHITQPVLRSTLHSAM